MSKNITFSNKISIKIIENCNNGRKVCNIKSNSIKDYRSETWYYNEKRAYIVAKRIENELKHSDLLENRLNDELKLEKMINNRIIRCNISNIYRLSNEKLIKIVSYIKY